MSDDLFNPPRQLNYSRGKISELAPFFEGQMITADDMNELVEALKELDERINELEAKCRGRPRASP